MVNTCVLCPNHQEGMAWVDFEEFENANLKAFCGVDTDSNLCIAPNKVTRHLRDLVCGCFEPWGWATSMAANGDGDRRLRRRQQAKFVGRRQADGVTNIAAPTGRS